MTPAEAIATLKAENAALREQVTTLLEMRTRTDQARAQGHTRLPVAQRDALVARYEQVLTLGRAANPPPPRRPRRRGRVNQSPVRNLLERLRLGQAQALAFLDDLTIPFDNNQAERDLRSYLSTLCKQGVALLEALRAVAVGSPLYPALG